jgi:hypothetical protein
VALSLSVVLSLPAAITFADSPRMLNETAGEVFCFAFVLLLSTIYAVYHIFHQIKEGTVSLAVSTIENSMPSIHAKTCSEDEFSPKFIITSHTKSQMLCFWCHHRGLLSAEKSRMGVNII